MRGTKSRTKPFAALSNLEKSLRLSLDKLKSTSGTVFASSSRTKNSISYNNNNNNNLERCLKRTFMSKVNPNCIRDEKVTALKLHEVVCETLQVQIALRDFRLVLKQHEKDMSSSFEFEDFLQVVRELSREMTTGKGSGAEGSGDSATFMRKIQQPSNNNRAISFPKNFVNPAKQSINKQADFKTKKQSESMNMLGHKDTEKETPIRKAVTKRHGQTTRDICTAKIKEQTTNLHNHDDLSLALSKEDLNDLKDDQKGHSEGNFSTNGTFFNPEGDSVLSHSVPKQTRSSNAQSTAQAISIKKLEPNLIRLFVSDNMEKTEYTLNTRIVLGRGSFGKVYKAISTGPKNYAIKELNSQFEEFEKNWKRTISKKNVQQRLRKCPYIYNIIHIAEEKKRKKYWHVFEFIEGISLHKIAHEKKELVVKDQNLQIWFSQLFSAVHFLNYKLKIVHRDIKTDNVLILHDPSRIKLIDFDHATLWDEPITTCAGAPICLPPEVLIHGQHRYTPAADWWMIGVLLFDVITGRHPFLICKTMCETRGPRRSIDYDLTEENIKAGFKGFTSEHNYKLPNGARSLVHELLTYEPKLRLGFSSHDFECRILNHPFFSNFNWSRVWKWIDGGTNTLPLQTKMAPSGDGVKTRSSRLSLTEAPMSEQTCDNLSFFGRTSTSKFSIAQHGSSNYTIVNASNQSRVMGDTERATSMTNLVQHRRPCNMSTSGDVTSGGLKWAAQTARPAAITTYQLNDVNTTKRKVQTSRSIAGPSNVQALKKTSSGVQMRRTDSLYKQTKLKENRCTVVPPGFVAWNRNDVMKYKTKQQVQQPVHLQSPTVTPKYLTIHPPFPYPVHRGRYSYNNSISDNRISSKPFSENNFNFRVHQ